MIYNFRISSKDKVFVNRNHEIKLIKKKIHSRVYIALSNKTLIINFIEKKLIVNFFFLFEKHKIVFFSFIFFKVF